MGCFGVADVTNNAMIINTFNSDNSNSAKIKTQNCQIMTTITNRILKFKPMIGMTIVTNYTFLIVLTFSNIISFTKSVESIHQDKKN